ncbi:MAG TPA: AAA family ATPase [Candidatus Polarisedimenticolia bacterium]|nr:AAA family ATPase [Candidatus Polarisedimenticolia bacterium]
MSTALRLIGLTGPNAAGKGEVAACLAARGFVYHSLSDVLRDELRRAGLPPTRENLIAVGNELRAAHGPGVLAEKILERLTGRDVVDSIRNPAEVEVLRRVAGFVLIGVDAPLQERFRRAVSRGRPGDGPTLDEFREKEARENSPDVNRQQLARTFAMADRTLMNEGSLDDLHRRVEDLLLTLAERSPAALQ